MWEGVTPMSSVPPHQAALPRRRCVTPTRATTVAPACTSGTGSAAAARWASGARPARKVPGGGHRGGQGVPAVPAPPHPCPRRDGQPAALPGQQPGDMERAGAARHPPLPPGADVPHPPPPWAAAARQRWPPRHRHCHHHRHRHPAGTGGIGGGLGGLIATGGIALGDIVQVWAVLHWGVQPWGAWPWGSVIPERGYWHMGYSLGGAVPGGVTLGG